MGHRHAHSLKEAQTLACSLVRKGSMVSEGALLVGFLEEGAFSANPEKGAGRD